MGQSSKQERLKSGYWWNRAKLAALEGHNADALAYYQLALQKRREAPRVSHGNLRDDLGEEAQALWKKMGGTIGVDDSGTPHSADRGGARARPATALLLARMQAPRAQRQLNVPDRVGDVAVSTRDRTSGRSEWRYGQ